MPRKSKKTLSLDIEKPVDNIVIPPIVSPEQEPIIEPETEPIIEPEPEPNLVKYNAKLKKPMPEHLKQYWEQKKQEKKQQQDSKKINKEQMKIDEIEKKLMEKMEEQMEKTISLKMKKLMSEKPLSQPVRNIPIPAVATRQPLPAPIATRSRVQQNFPPEVVMKTNVPDYILRFINGD